MVPSLSFVPLSSELHLASHGQQLTCMPQVFVYLKVSWTMGSRKPWRKVCSGKWTLTLSAWLRVLSPDRVLVKVSWSISVTCAFIITICNLASLNVCPKISYSHVWIILILLSLGLTERCGLQPLWLCVPPSPALKP